MAVLDFEYKTLRVLAGIFIFYTGFAFAQDTENKLVFTGKVIDAVKGTPVVAKITFESLPDNAEVHILESKKEDGSFVIEFHENTFFNILINAPYYKPEMDTVFPGNNIGEKIYRLLPVNKGEVLLLQNIYFSQGDFKILEASRGELTELLFLLNEYPKMEIRLEGHTDKQGGRQSNLELSEKRVSEIRTYLIANGITSKRVKIKAFGDMRPISTENTEEAHKANRRVEARILKI